MEAFLKSVGLFKIRLFSRNFFSPLYTLPGWGGGHLMPKCVGMPIGSRDLYTFPDRIETPFPHNSYEII